MQPERLFRSADAGRCSLCAALISCCAGAAAFALSAWAIGSCLTATGRGLQNDALEQKWRQFERQAADCDVLFIGTSRVHRNLEPAAFDEALYQQGLRVRSFNLGLPRMSILEAKELLERLANRGPSRLKFVVLEPMLYIFDLDNWTSPRDMAMHDWDGARLAIGNTIGAESRRGSAWHDRLHYASPHLLSYGCRAVNLGSAAPSVFPSCLPEDGDRKETARDELAGFAPLPVRNDRQAPWRERFKKFLALPQPPDWRGKPLSAAELDYLRHLVACIRQAGAEPVFLLGPRVKRDSHTVAVLESHAERFADVLLLDYLRGHGNPELYEIEDWYDFDHLNAAGARKFSERVARDLAPLMAHRGPRDERLDESVALRRNATEGVPYRRNTVEDVPYKSNAADNESIRADQAPVGEAFEARRSQTRRF